MDAIGFAAETGSGNKITGILCRGAMASVAMFALSMLAFAASAAAEFSPQYEVSRMSPERADSVPTIAATVRQEVTGDDNGNGRIDANERDGETAIRDGWVKFPAGWKVNNPAVNELQPCSRNSFNRPHATDPDKTACNHKSIIGTVEADTWLGATRVIGFGKVYLLESNADDEAVKAGVFLKTYEALDTNRDGVFERGTQLLPYRFNVDTTVVGQPGQERIKFFYSNLPRITVGKFVLTLKDDSVRNGGGAGIVRTSPRSGQATVEAQFVDHDNNPSQLLQSRVNLAPATNKVPRNVLGIEDPSAVFRPVLNVRLSAGANPTTTLALMDDPANRALDNRMNNSAAGFQSLNQFSLNFPPRVRLNTNAVQRCDDQTQSQAWANGAEPCRASSIGTTSMYVVAAAQEHLVRGNVYLSDPLVNGDAAGLLLVYPNPPKRLDIDDNLATRDPIVLRARILPGGITRILPPIMPKVYEIREFYLTINGRVGVSNVITKQGACDGRNPGDLFVGVFRSDRGASSQFWRNCADGERAQWAAP